MADEKRKIEDLARKRHNEAEVPSKGQYGGLTGLGPGGGRDIKEATETDDIGPDDVEPTRKQNA